MSVLFYFHVYIYILIIRSDQDSEKVGAWLLHFLRFCESRLSLRLSLSPLQSLLRSCMGCPVGMLLTTALQAGR